jgi:hypothetical protein
MGNVSSKEEKYQCAATPAPGDYFRIRFLMKGTSNNPMPDRAGQ